MPYNAMKNRAFVPEEKFMREALSLAACFSLPLDEVFRQVKCRWAPLL